MDKLDLQDRIIVAAAGLLFIDSFIPWFKWEYGPFSATRSASSYPLAWLAVLAGVAMAAQVVLTKLTEVDLPEKLGNLSWGKVHMIAGIAVAVLVLLQTLMGDSPADRSFGTFLGIAFAGALAYAGVMKGREDAGTA